MAESVEIAEQHQSVVARFIEQARASAAVVTEVADLETAISYTVDLCGSQAACRLEAAGGDTNLSRDADGFREPEQTKIIAAPGLDPAAYKLLNKRCGAHGFICIDSGMRSPLSGVDIGFSYADIGIAETGTLVLNCPGEELRLATMICECHVCVLPKSKIVKDGFAAEEQLQRFMRKAPNYTAFITGPSRTADIERVLTIGVHGPLELHILMMEG